MSTESATHTQAAQEIEPSPFAAMREAWIKAGVIDPNAPTPAAQPLDTAAVVRESRMNRFREVCPAEFRKNIDRAMLPNLAAWDEADAWSMSSPGIFLWSHASGKGKSRMAWRIFGRAHVELGKHVLKCSGQSLVEDYFECHMDGEPRNFYRRMLAPEILIIDDFDKAEFSERNRRAIRELWDELYANRKAVVVTSNEPIEWFIKPLGESCVRRMREVCREIAF